MAGFGLFALGTVGARPGPERLVLYSVGEGQEGGQSAAAVPLAPPLRARTILPPANCPASVTPVSQSNCPASVTPVSPQTDGQLMQALDTTTAGTTRMAFPLPPCKAACRPAALNSAFTGKGGEFAKGGERAAKLQPTPQPHQKCVRSEEVGTWFVQARHSAGRSAAQPPASY